MLDMSSSFALYKHSRELFHSNFNPGQLTLDLYGVHITEHQFKRQYELRYTSSDFLLTEIQHLIENNVLASKCIFV